MRVLITGGAGFIGSNLCEASLERGDDVHILDDLSTGSFENIRHLSENPRFGYTIGNVLQRPLVARLIEECDAVFHLAAAVGVKLIVQSPVRTIGNDVHGTAVVLGLAGKKKKRMLLTSTSEVYYREAYESGVRGYVAPRPEPYQDRTIEWIPAKPLLEANP